jgi:peptide deformylase
MVLEVIKYGHPVLREKGKRVERVTEEIRLLVANMIETMRAEDGVGLAAQQVGHALMLTVIDVSSSERPSQLIIDGESLDIATSMPLVLLNPKISKPEGEQIASEGCLSVPDINAEIRRAEKVTVSATGLNGKELVFDCTGLLARAAQHEIDHLNGILFINRMDAATRVSLAGKLKKMEKETLAKLAKTAKPRRRLVRS